MTDNGDGTWSMSFTLPEGDTIEYKFQNGLDGWENSIPSECTLGGFGNRFVVVGNADIELDLVCFNACVGCSTNTNDLAFDNAISIYPNLVNEVLFVQMDFPGVVENLQLKLMNVAGKQVFVKNLSDTLSETFELSTEDLAKGTYFLQLTSEQASVMKKFVVQ